MQNKCNIQVEYINKFSKKFICNEPQPPDYKISVDRILIPD